MSDSLESALIIQLTDSIKWDSALPTTDLDIGTLTPVDPNAPFNVLEYARRDREMQHRDLINAAAVAKVSIRARTVWSGSVPYPRMQGNFCVAGNYGTNVHMPVNRDELGSTLPVVDSKVIYVKNSDVPYDSIRIADISLYRRDSLLYETLARAATIFPDPPVGTNYPDETVIGSTTAWATASGTHALANPNSALPLNRDLFAIPESNLADRDNQVAAYAARVVEALKNPFEYASRVYVSVSGADIRESETYVLCNTVYSEYSTYTAGEEVLYAGSWYRAKYTTIGVIPTDTSTWEAATTSPVMRQFMADPALDSRNRIVYNTTQKTLQWYRETLDQVHTPQIVGFAVTGILPGQTVNTVPLTPERKDSQFYRQKAARVSLSSGTWESKSVVFPTGGVMTGGINTVYNSAKAVALMTPSTATVEFTGVTCPPGTYAMTALIRPSQAIVLAGSDGIPVGSGGTATTDGGVDIPSSNTSTPNSIGYTLNLPAGTWRITFEYSNSTSATVSSLGFSASVGGNVIQLPYTDLFGSPLANGTLLTSPPVDLPSSGRDYTVTISRESGTGILHIKSVTFYCALNDSSHYIMQASLDSSISKLDVIGVKNVPEVLPFTFYVPIQAVSPAVTISWNRSVAPGWSPTQSYYPGDQVLDVSTNAYWESNAIIPAGSTPPGNNTAWILLRSEPQIPMVISHLHLQYLRPTAVTPAPAGFAGFRQDMLERANRSDQDSYRACVAAAGTNIPEFRTSGTTSWGTNSTDSWMAFQEVYNPRLREIVTVSGGIGHDRQYQVTGTSGNLTYNSLTYISGDKFYGVEGIPNYTKSGNAQLIQVGAYRKSAPGDIGQPALVPDGLTFVPYAGTVAARLGTAESYPTIQALQPWMVESGIYVAQTDLWSPSTM